jgi:hypothetical protein
MAAAAAPPGPTPTGSSQWGQASITRIEAELQAVVPVAVPCRPSSRRSEPIGLMQGQHRPLRRIALTQEQQLGQPWSSPHGPARRPGPPPRSARLLARGNRCTSCAGPSGSPSGRHSSKVADVASTQRASTRAHPGPRRAGAAPPAAPATTAAGPARPHRPAGAAATAAARHRLGDHLALCRSTATARQPEVPTSMPTQQPSSYPAPRQRRALARRSDTADTHGSCTGAGACQSSARCSATTVV